MFKSIVTTIVLNVLQDSILIKIINARLQRIFPIFALNLIIIIIVKAVFRAIKPQTMENATKEMITARI